MLLDTSGLFCCHHARETASDEAVALFDAARLKLVHNYIVSEFVAPCKARGLPRTKTLSFLQALLVHPEVECVWVDPSLNADALELHGARLDKGYSLCDAVSFVLMRQRGLRNALTTDHHFEQEGFIRLLK
jgi:uncharacterized protein